MHAGYDTHSFQLHSGSGQEHAGETLSPRLSSNSRCWQAGKCPPMHRNGLPGRCLSVYLVYRQVSCPLPPGPGCICGSMGGCLFAFCACASGLRGAKSGLEFGPQAGALKFGGGGAEFW